MEKIKEYSLIFKMFKTKENAEAMFLEHFNTYRRLQFIEDLKTDVWERDNGPHFPSSL